MKKKKNRGTKKKMSISDWIIVVFLVLGLLAMIFWGFPSLDYYPGKPF